MNLIKAAIDRPTAVLSAVLMAILFGMVALQTIPIQLAPDVQRPVISVRTMWPGAAPVDVEREIINEQEDVLKGLEGLKRMVSSASNGRARITLEFGVDQDMDKALLLVANRLDRVSTYPDEADEPSLSMAGAEDNPIAWFRLLRTEGNDRPINEYGDFAEDVIKERIERVTGVSEVNVFGGTERQMEVIVDPILLSQYRLTVGQVVDRLRAANASISGGDVDEGKRRYIVRTDNEFTSPEEVAAVVLRSERDPGTGRVARVTVGNIATVQFGYKEPGAKIRSNALSAMALNATRETGANVIETMAGIREAVTELNDYVLPAEGLVMEQLYDETIYIQSAIDLVIQNIWVGGTFAVVVLLVFLRSVRATLVVALAIPVSVVASFVAMAFLGRSLNVVSLAGIAFAVGMVVDAAIVVLENIYRLRQAGKPVTQAAYEGTQQVWGAILVSALTTVMVFIPILVMELEVGQLFRDIAVAISVAVMLSLLVSVTVIPALSNYLLQHGVKPPNEGLRLPGLDGFARLFMAAVTRLTRAVIASKTLAISMVTVMTLTTAGLAWVFLPKLEYLPEGNRNFIFGVVFPPPGYNLDTMREMGERIEASVRHHWASETGPEAAPGEPPKMTAFFFVATRVRTFLGAQSAEPERTRELIPVLRAPVFREPGTFGVMVQPSIFGRGVGGARSVDMDISGPELETVIATAQRAFGMVNGVMPLSDGNQIRPRPGLELGAPEVRVKPDLVRLSDNNVTARELGLTVDAFNDELRVAEITVDGGLMDLMLKGTERNVVATQEINSLPVVTESGTIVPVQSLATVQVTAGPTQIRHIEGQRTVTLQIRPAPQVPLETALNTLQFDVIGKMQEQGLPPGVRIRLTGTAEKLAQTWAELKLDLLLAVIIVFLVMAVLFESFIYPLVILLAVPLAAAGGVGGLTILNLFKFEPLHMLTMLGFVILIGIVVNNAILLVHQTLYHIREESMAPGDAIVEATRNRIRPILMSTLTSVFGMLPLVVFPGAGSEIYRGLGSVVVGGLALSALLTLLTVPPLMSVTVGVLEGRRASRRSKAGVAEPAE